MAIVIGLFTAQIAGIIFTGSVSKRQFVSRPPQMVVLTLVVCRKETSLGTGDMSQRSLASCPSFRSSPRSR